MLPHLNDSDAPALTGELLSSSCDLQNTGIGASQGVSPSAMGSSPGTTPSSQESDGAPGFLVSPFALWVCHWPALSFGACLASTASMTDFVKGYDAVLHGLLSVEAM
jgi:hypothetical protein